MIEQTRTKRTTDISRLGGSIYAFDSTTIDLGPSLSPRAKLRKSKGGIKMRTLYYIETQIPAFAHITSASTHDTKVMPRIPYRKGAYCIFDRGYNDFGNFFTIG